MLGVANNALYLGLGYIGLHTVSAGLGGLIVSANPVFTAVLAALLGEALTWRKVSGLLLGIAGVAFIVWHRISVGTDDCTASCSRWRRWPRSSPARSCSSCWRRRAACGSATVCRTSPAGWRCCRSRSRFSSVSEIVPSGRLFGAFAFLVLGGSILAYLLWFHLLKVCGATAASAYHFLMPPLGMLFAWLVLGEHVEFRDLSGSFRSRSAFIW